MSQRTYLSLLLVAGGIVVAGLAAAAQVTDYRPVTAAMALNPDPADWLHFRRTLDGQGYSPLNQITRQNAHQLQLVWSWTAHHGASELTPQVHDGIMFISNPNGGVQALDAATGDLLWDFHLPLTANKPRGGGDDDDAGGGVLYGNAAGPSRPVRNLALWGDKVYTGTSEHHGGRLIALDARTGAVVWQKQTGFGHSGGPIAADGKIVIGTTRCERFRKNENNEPPCYITAYDAETGNEVWRTSTIQRLGDPGPDSWSGLPSMFRAGGDNWQAGSYDPKTNLTYWGTAQAKPWIPFQRGTDGTALYTSSTLAIDIDTGKLAWYHQHIPGEAFDMDETFERVLIDYDGRSSVFSMGKIGILWELDRQTGAFRAAHDLGYQDQGKVDPKTGQLMYHPGRLPQAGKRVSFCPSVSGFKTWAAMAYHPQTHAVYIPLMMLCATATPGPAPVREEGSGGVGGYRNTDWSFHPASPDALGEFVAIDIRNGNKIWRHRTRTPPAGSALTTGGGLVVQGNWDRTLYIYDATNGKVLYQTRLPGPPVGSPTTYVVRGKQYLAIPLGAGSSSGAGWMSSARTLTPEKKSAAWAEYPNGVHVFALPQN